MDNYRFVTVERRDHVALVNFNRPAVCNAVNYEFLCEIEHCALSFREDATSRVVIFGTEGRHFSAGADLNEVQNAKPESLIEKRNRLRLGERVFHALLEIDQITIAAWNGGAIGGGGCMAVACDFRIGADDCFLFYPEIDLGLNLMWQSLPRLVRLVGETRAMRLTIGGERVAAETLQDWGLLESVVPRAELQQTALAFAETYVTKSPIAAQMIKRSVNAIGGHLDRAFMHMDVEQHMLAATSEDHQAATSAYINKTTPQFSGN